MVKKGKTLCLLVISVCFVLILGACKSNTVTEPNKEDKPNQPNQQEENKEPEKKLEGKIRISLSGVAAGQAADQSVWGKVADAYMEKNPGVEVIVDNKPTEGYQEWVTAQFATGDVPEVDLVTANVIPASVSDNKLIDFLPYFDQVNPYTNKLWKESFDLDTMQVNMDVYKATDQKYESLNFESIQIMWIYNKDILKEAGYDQPPETFDDLMKMFEDIKKLGYTPFSIGGNSTSLWSGKAGWAIRIYADQYFRDSIKLVHSQEDDYTWFDKLDGQWEYDPSDPYNDNRSHVTTNDLRVWKAIHEKEAPYRMTDEPRWERFYENMKKLFSYASDGFAGMTDDEAYKEFLTGKSATMLGDPSFFWQIPKDFKDAELTGSEGGVEPFEYGFFNFPTIKDDLVLADARTIHIPIGFYGAVAKDAEQNALTVDFLQFWTSPEGYNIYLEAIQNSDSMSLTGPPALKDIQLPSDMEEAFAQFESIGNMEGLPNAANVLARGLSDYQPSVQDWVSLTQQYFAGKMSTKEYLEQYQKNIEKDFEGALKERNYELSDLEHVERKPPERN
ncbi:ABC transporter substrate-binding protein [Lederbergia citri]|uniref:Extracellular solute-binding protein n=1 Tax=Lederbergia citri TaxID=2833580 RepID=A0A942TJ39_9BACI|nr:extracellular solute-binding protein [Lederbergia citri]MBS4197002.1 extracellular solute-binding protein [Lederbergia citri]